MAGTHPDRDPAQAPGLISALLTGEKSPAARWAVSIGRVWEGREGEGGSEEGGREGVKKEGGSEGRGREVEGGLSKTVFIVVKTTIVLSTLPLYNHRQQYSHCHIISKVLSSSNFWRGGMSLGVTLDLKRVAQTYPLNHSTQCVPVCKG